jgi:hypothetical protein
MRPLVYQQVVAFGKLSVAKPANKLLFRTGSTADASTSANSRDSWPGSR